MIDLNRRIQKQNLFNPDIKDFKVMHADEEMGLYELCNYFEYQRYGKVKDEDDLALPYIVSNPVKFYLIAPDGKNFGTDLIERANYMENMK